MNIDPTTDPERLASPDPEGVASTDPEGLASPDTERLDAARRAIEQADRDMIAAMARRFEAVRLVAETKRAQDRRPLLDADRERALLARWTQDAEAMGLSEPFARRILKEMLNHSRRLQEPLIHGRLHPQRARVGYQGIPGSYSALAAAHLMATRSAAGADLIGHRGFGDAVDRLQAGELDYALLPVENSIGGSIHDVNRLICEQALHLVDEEVWPVEHVLAARPGAELSGVREVRSHPAALVQCETFLRSLDRAERAPWFDTAGAAESLAGETALDVAAICSQEAAHTYGLAVLAHGIADRDRNETRFVLLARDPELPDPRTACKTSMLFRLHHHDGALARALSVLADAGVNLSRIESRPVPETPWEYLFFVDVDGHLEAPPLRDAMGALQAACHHLRVLGCYPSRTRRSDQHLSEPVPRPVSVEPPAVPSSTTAREPSVVQVGQVAVGAGHFVLIAGPTAPTSRSQLEAAAQMVQRAGGAVLRGGSIPAGASTSTLAGPGASGLEALRDAGRAYDLPVMAEVLTIADVPAAASHADVLLVGAQNMHNFPLLKALGRVDRPVVLERGMGATVQELVLAAEYILAGGNQRVILCERGIRSFEPSTPATLDVSAVPVLKSLTHLPVLVDPSQAAGRRELVLPLALAAAAAGADGLIVDAHPGPEEAPEPALGPDALERLIDRLGPIVAASGRAWR